MPFHSMSWIQRQLVIAGFALTAVIATLWLINGMIDLRDENARIINEKKAVEERLARHQEKMGEIAYRLMRLESSLGSLHADARALDATTQRPIRRLMQHTRLALTNDERLLRLATKERLFGEDAGREHVEAFSYMMDATHRIEVNLKDMADQLALLHETVPKRLEFWAQVPVEKPADGKLSSDFGMRHSPLDGHKKKHMGLDIANSVGTPIRAPADGVVRAAYTYGGYGKYISIVHSNDLVTRFAHLDDIHVKKGDKVKRGQIIGAMGTTGRSTGPHLHYEIRFREESVDPMAFMFDPSADPKTLTANK